MNYCDKLITDKNCNIIVNDGDFIENYIKVFILKYNKTGETKVLIKSSEELLIIFNMKDDGFYTLCELQVPIDERSVYYYKNNKFYHNINEVCLLELIEVNPEVSNINIYYSYHFIMCNLKHCFMHLCDDIYNLSSSKCNTLGYDSSLIYKRNLLLASINVINYLVEFDLFEEALRLLDEITSCNGLCNKREKGCGCQA